MKNTTPKIEKTDKLEKLTESGIEYIQKMGYDSTHPIGALYIRVSTEEQSELSPDAQKRLMLDYAAKHNLLIPKEYIFIDDGITGRKTDKRLQFNRMITLAKQKPTPFTTILVHKFSRFARNQEDSIVYKSLLKKQCGINVVSTSEPLIEGPYGSLIERIIEWMDEFYSINLSGEVMKGMTEKALRGGYQARPPLGYKILRKGEPPQIIPEEAETIRLIFSKYVYEGMPIYELTRYLNRLGLNTRQGRPFEKRSVEYILQNPMYMGIIRWNRVENATNIVKDKEEWIVTKGAQEAIIDEETFEKAQERYKNDYKPKGARPASTYKHWLSGITKCSSCQRTLIATGHLSNKNNKTYYSFQCYGYTKGKCLTSHGISSKKLEKAVLEILTRDMTAASLNELEFEVVETKIPSSNELEQLEAQLDRVSLKETRIKLAYQDGIDTLDEYKQNKRMLTKERDDLLEHISILQTNNQPKPKSIDFIQKQLSSVYDIITSDAFAVPHKSESIQSIISKIVYNRPNDSVKIYYRI